MQSPLNILARPPLEQLGLLAIIAACGDIMTDHPTTHPAAATQSIQLGVFADRFCHFAFGTPFMGTSAYQCLSHAMCTEDLDTKDETKVHSHH